MSTTPTISPCVAQLAYVDHGSGRAPVASTCSGVFPFSIVLPSPTCVTTATSTGVHISSLSLTNSINLESTGTLYYNSRPKPLSPHPQLAYNYNIISTTPMNKMEMQGCDHSDGTLINVDLKSFQLQHKNHANLMLPRLDSSTNSSISSNSSHQECRPSVDTVLLEIALNLAEMKRS